MADNEDTELLRLDLDNDEFLKKVLESNNALKELGNVSNLEGLLEGMAAAVPALAAILVAVYAVKTALNLVEEAEKIKRVNDQFKSLAENAGLVGDVLREKVIKAAGGLADDVDVIQKVNTAIVGMGNSASRLPEVMELARKVTKLMGGDLLEVFGSLNQALATGQTRMLRHYQIIVDQNKAWRDYANQLGIAVGSLSEMEKHQAVMNAALEAGQKRYAGVSSDTNNVIDTFAKLKTTLTELKEVAAVFFESFAGNAVRSSLNGISKWFHDYKTDIVSNFGTGTDQITARIEAFQRRVKDYGEEYNRLSAVYEKVKGRDPFVESDVKEKIRVAYEQLQAYRISLKNVIEEGAKVGVGPKAKEAAGGASTEEGAQAAKEEAANLELRKNNNAKFYAELATLRKEYENLSLAAETDISKVDAHIEAQIVSMKEQTLAKVQQVNQSTHLSESQKATEIIQVNKNAELQIEALARKRLQVISQVIDQLSKKEGTATQKFVNGWTAASLKARQKLTDWSQHGQDAANDVTGALTEGFTNIGKGADSMGDALKKAFLGVLGKRAIAEGSVLLLSGLWPPNPIALAAGAGLVTLGGLLSAQAGEGGGGGVSAPSSAGSASPTTSAAADATNTALLSQQAAPSAAAAAVLPSRQVELHVHGDLIETDSTARWIMEMMRKETDTSAFELYKVGGK